LRLKTIEKAAFKLYSQMATLQRLTVFYLWHAGRNCKLWARIEAALRVVMQFESQKLVPQGASLECGDSSPLWSGTITGDIVRPKR
jgi:hypothetical protein